MQFIKQFFLIFFSLIISSSLIASKKAKLIYVPPQPQKILICLEPSGLIEAGILLKERFGTLIAGSDADRAIEGCKTIGNWLKTKQIKTADKTMHYLMELKGAKELIQCYNFTKEDAEMHFIPLGGITDYIQQQQEAKK